jgi:DnaK suppressor protein
MISVLIMDDLGLAAIPSAAPTRGAPAKARPAERSSLARFKSMLEESKHQLLASTKRTRAGHPVIDSDDLADDLDLANAEFSQSLTLQFLDRDEHALEKIQSALDRIEDGIFGICEGCGGDISEKRLAVRPTTILCIQCQEDAERETKRSFG